MFKEVALAVNNRLRDAQDGGKALLDIFNHPFGFLHLALQVLAGVLPIAFENVGVHLIYPQLGNHAIIQRGYPDTLDFFDYHIVLDKVVMGKGGKLAAGLGVLLQNELLCAPERGFVTGKKLAQFDKVLVGKQRQMVLRNQSGLTQIRRLCR